MKKIGIVATLAAVALLLGLAGLGQGMPKAKAEPTGILALNEFIVNMLSGATCSWAEGGAGCDLTDPVDVADIEANDGDDDGVAEPSDFEDLDYDGDQVPETAYTVAVWILVFVDDDDPVIIDPRSNMFFDEDADGDGDLECNDGASEDNYFDEDCDSDGTAGDEVVVGTLYNDTADPGDEEEVEAQQEGEYTDIDVTIVGDPDEITLTALEDTIQGDDVDCGDLDISDLMDEAEDVSVAGLLATVEDSDGTALAGVFVDWESDDEDVVELTQDSTITLVLDDGTFAVNLACGGDTGTADVDAEIDHPVGDVESDTVTITVIGAPADVALTASPAEIVCDGVNSSDVTATVTDADGNPVVDGTEVHFDVVALGTAYPIVAETLDGAATSTITPLSDIGAGVTVIVWAGDAEASIRVDCTEAPPPVAPPPVVPPPAEPGITPPPTGTGGYLGSDAAGLSWLALAGLAIGGLTLSLGSIALRRYAR